MGFTGRCKDGEGGRDIECQEEHHVSCWKKVEGNSMIDLEERSECPYLLYFGKEFTIF